MDILKKNYIELSKLSNISEKKYQEICDLIIDKNIIKSVNEIINFILNDQKKYGKKILVSYLIYYYPEYTIENKESELYLFSEKIVNMIDIFIKNKEIIIFNSYIDIIKKYLNFFDIWKKNDYNSQIDGLINMYWEIENTIYNNIKNENEQDKYDINNLKNLQEKIIIDLKLLGGYEIFKKTEVTFFDTKFIELITKNLKDSYWVFFEDKLKQDKPDYSVLLEVLNDVKYMIISLIPNRFDIHNELHEAIDIKYIKQMIDNEAIEPIFIKNIVNYIVDKVEKLGSKEDEKNIKLWKDDIEKQFINGFEYYEFFPNFFKKVFNKLEEIKKDIEVIKNSDFYETIKNIIKDKN